MKHNKKERKMKKEHTENKSSHEVLKENIIQVRECEGKLMKSKKHLQSNKERVHIKCDKLQNIIACVEARHKVLVEWFKDKSCRVILAQHEEEYFEVEDAKNKTNEEFKLDAKDEYFDNHGLEIISDNEKDLLSRKINGWMHFICFIGWK